MIVTPDGVRYLAIGRGERVTLPFHLRWLPCILGRDSLWRWRAVQVGSCVAIAALLAMFLHQRGLGGPSIIAGVCLAAVLGGVGRTFRVFPILTDPTAQAFALGSAVAWQAGWWPLAIVLALAAGASKEWAPVHAAIWAWNPILLVGLVVVGLRLLQRPGVELEGAGINMRPHLPRWPDQFDPRWLDPRFVALPWGACLVALAVPSWPLAAALAVSYAGVFATEFLFDSPVMGAEVNCSRCFQWAFPLMILATVTVLPVEWLPAAVLVCLLNPWGRGPVIPPQDHRATVPVDEEAFEPGLVTIGYNHPGQLEEEFAGSLMAAYAYEAAQPKPILDGHPIRVAGGPRLHTLRDAIVRQFLAGPGQWLLIADADMEFTADAPRRLLASADPISRPIVGGLCFGTGRSGGALFPTIYEWADGRFSCQFDVPDDTLVQCDGTGAAFLLVHRSVLEALRDASPDGDLQPWFPDGQVGDQMVECDLAFCLRAGSLGFPIYVNTAVEARHKKVQWLDLAFYRSIRAGQSVAV